MILIKSLSSVLLALALAGCMLMRHEPLLTFPDPPSLKFYRCVTKSETMICFSQEDAAALDKWLEKVQLFEEARQRLLR